MKRSVNCAVNSYWTLCGGHAQPMWWMWAKVVSFICLNFTLSWHLNCNFFSGRISVFSVLPLLLGHKIPFQEVLAFQSCHQNATVSGNIMKYQFVWGCFWINTAWALRTWFSRCQNHWHLWFSTCMYVFVHPLKTSFFTCLQDAAFM